MIDEPDISAMLAAQSAAAAQIEAGMRDLAGTLGTFRTQLVLQGFTTDGAERIAQDFFCAILDATERD